MYSPLRSGLKYLRYYLAASNGKGHGIHSPFVFEFITKVMNDTTVYPAYHEVEHLRALALKNNKAIPVNDLGAGSSRSGGNTRTIRSIARHAVKPSRFGQLFYRIVNFYKPSIIVELGTSLGITTSYLSKANPAARVITLEGAESILTEASNNFRLLAVDNIETVPGNFDLTLGPLLTQLPSVDFAFIDGNHRLQPTCRYFDSMVKKVNDYSMVIVDDIHWSEDMEEAWKYCADHPAVTLSIDLFFIGILIFRKEIKEKQHFMIRF